MCCGKQVWDVVGGVQMWPEMVMTPYKTAPILTLLHCRFPPVKAAE